MLKTFSLSKKNSILASTPLFMESTLKSVRQVSFWLFFTIGILHISSSILAAQNVVTPESKVIFYALDLPFLFFALVYASSQATLLLGKVLDNKKTALIFSIFVSAMIFLIALIWNFNLLDAPI